MRTAWQKMLAGERYDPMDPELRQASQQARRLCHRLNTGGPDDEPARPQLFAELFGQIGDGIWVLPPFHCDYGKNITLGHSVFINCNCVILDCAQVRIGNHVFIGPAVQIYTACHPLDPVERATEISFARPVEIGSDVWIGGGAILCPGVKIGERSVIGAGSVVTRDIPPDVVAAGNPCRVLRPIPSHADAA